MLDILHEDDELLILNKPAGLVCHPTKGDAWSSLISRVRLHLGGAARPHLIHRLDRETSGVTVVAISDHAARDLRRMWENHAVRKEYLAIVHGHVRDNRCRVDAPLGKDERSRVAIKDCVREDGAPAQTDFEIVNRFSRGQEKFSLLRVWPRTGRKHQIRIHLAHLGYPIVGDKLYGADEDLYLALVEDRLTETQRATLLLPHQALHAASLTFPWKQSTITFTAAPEPWFTDFTTP